MREKESDEKKEVLLESRQKTLASLYMCRTKNATEKKIEKNKLSKRKQSLVEYNQTNLFWGWTKIQ